MLHIYGSFYGNLFVTETSRVVYNNIVVFVNLFSFHCGASECFSVSTVFGTWLMFQEM